MLGVSIEECTGFVQRTITTGSETYIENIYSDVPSCKLVFRKLSNSSETVWATRHLCKRTPHVFGMSGSFNCLLHTSIRQASKFRQGEVPPRFRSTLAGVRTYQATR